MNGKLMTALSVALVAGSAFGQVRVEERESFEERVEALKAAEQAMQQRVHKIHANKLAFAGVEDGVVTVPLRVAEGNESNINITTDEVRIKVEQDGSDVIVFIDGEEVFNGELASDFETFEFTTADDTVVKLVNAKGDDNVFYFEHGAGLAELELRGALELAQVGQNYAQAFTLGGHPKVMMGVTLNGVERTVAKQLGLDRERTTLIGSVIDDLPAKKAGLEADDIVVAVDGNTDASPSGIREVLSEKQPGDTLVLDVIREGRDLQVVLDLEAYDGKALGNSVFTSTVPGQNFWTTEVSEETFQEWLQGLVNQREDLRAAAADATDTLKQTELRAAMSKLEAQIEEARQKIAIGDFTIPHHSHNRLYTWSPEDLELKLNMELENLPNLQFFGEGQGSGVIVPRAPGATREYQVILEKLDRSAAEHKAKVEQMEARIQQLEAQLERALEQLEKENGPDA